MRVGDNANLVQLLRPGMRPTAAVELLMGGSLQSLASHVPAPPVVQVNTPAPVWSGDDLAQAFLNADEIASQRIHIDAIFAAELAFDLYDEQEQSAVTDSAIEAQQVAVEYEAQEHAYASWSAEAGAL